MLFALVIHSAAAMQTDPPSVQSAEETTVQATLDMPCVVEGTALIAERLVSYDGAFIENGSGYEVTNAAALMLKNVSDTGISWALVVLQQGNRTLTFEATQIPPKASVLVLEMEGKQYSAAPLSDCRGWMLRENSGWQPEEYLSFEEVDIGSVNVTNRTEAPLEGIRLYYKTEYADGLFYLGGITYEAYIDSLAPGQTVCLTPEHYAGGSSKFLRIAFGGT